MVRTYDDIHAAVQATRPDLSTTEVANFSAALNYMVKSAKQFARMPTHPMSVAYKESLLEMVSGILQEDIEDNDLLPDDVSPKKSRAGIVVSKEPEVPIGNPLMVAPDKAPEPPAVRYYNSEWTDGDDLSAWGF